MLIRACRSTRSPRWRRASLTGVATLGLGLGCSHAAPPTLTPLSVTVAPVRPGATPPSDPRPPPARPPAVREGCLANLPESAPTRELLEALTDRCIAGMTQLTGGAARRPPDEELPPTSVELFFDLSEGRRCVRFLAVGDSSMTSVELVLLDANRGLLERGESFGRFAMLPVEGTVCLDPGRFSAAARTATGEGELALYGFVTE
jgi:hypothetical protein